MDEVQARLAGRLERLPAQVIHGDLHGHNLILAEASTRIAGVIDFGDMFHGPAIVNLTNAMADFLHETDQPQAMWAALIKGYTGIYILKAAIEKVGKLDRKAVAAALKNVHFSVKQNPGILMDVAFDDKGDMDRESFLVEVKNGHQVVVDTLPALGKK